MEKKVIVKNFTYLPSVDADAIINDYVEKNNYIIKDIKTTAFTDCGAAWIMYTVLLIRKE